MAGPYSIRTWLTEKLGIRYPIIQAPMAGGTTTPQLVAAVGNAGALGSFAQRPPQAAMDRALASLRPMYEALGAATPSSVEAPYAPDLSAQVAAVLDVRPEVLSMHFSQLDPQTIAQLRDRGILLAASVTNLAEARHLEQLGLDFAIAQGAEAGGHRGTFIGADEDSMIGTLALIRTIARQCSIPVVAAGGIMDGAGLAAVLALGACGAQLGTAFLTVDESGTSDIHKQVLLDSGQDGTTVTRAFSGRSARGIRNAFIRRAEAEQFPILPFPVQNKATAALRAASAKQHNPDFVSLWAGQAFSLSRKLNAGELVATIVEEYEETSQELMRAARG
jgi:nitronate monooxygenase